MKGAGLVLALAVCACGSTTSSRTPTPRPSATSPTPHPIASAPDPCALPVSGPPTHNQSADFVTALAFAPDGTLFYAERAGYIYQVRNDARYLFAQVPTVTTEPNGSYSERGLLGLAVSPNFLTDHYVFAFYSMTDYQHQQVVRFTDCGGTAVNPASIATMPSGSDCCHKGGRLAFGTDGKLYVALGDEHTSTSAQNPHDDRGKILRFNPDGSIPADNPFGDEVFAMGFRNPFGIAFAPDGTLFVTGNGPSGDAGSPETGYDLATAVTRGGNYQWASCYGYSHVLYPATMCSGTEPMWSSENSTVVPTGATWVDGHAHQYQNHFVFCTYDSGMRIMDSLTAQTTVSNGPSGCRFDVKEGPNGAIYYSDETTIYVLP